MMSFSGKLEHLQIVDVMQLLHQTRKSGILRIKGRKGESQLVFKDGYMVSANHLNNSIRIGKILVDLDIITPEILDKALKIQSCAGTDRKPLVITLINEGLVNEKDAYKGLEYLIEIAIVEILTWKKGSFSFEVLPASNNDFRFYSGNLISEIIVDTQSALMDALRIFDEKRRDGELTDEELAEDELFAKGSSTAGHAEGTEYHPTGKVNAPEMPPEGLLVSCPRCRNIFHADKHAASRSPDMMNVCPACRYSTPGKETFAVCPQCGLVGSKYQAKLREKQELEWEQQHAQQIQKLLLRSMINPNMPWAPADAGVSNEAPLSVRYIGWAYSALGAALLCYGLYGLASYYGNDWQKIISESRLEPISKIEVFFRFGFLPWLFTLFSSLFLLVARRFMQLRNRARKEMQIAAWAGVAVCAVNEIADFISWIRISSSFSYIYYVTGLANSILMTVLWSLPFLVLLLFMRSKAIVREFSR